MDDPETILIRPATLDDAEAIAHINIDVWRSTYEGIVDGEFLDRMAIADYISKWQRILAPQVPESRWCFAACDGGSVVGYVSGGTNDDNDGYDAVLYALYLRAHYHGRGVGKLLWDAMMQAFEARRLRSFKLYVLKDNGTGRRFYERYRPDVREDATFTLEGNVYCDMLYGWHRLPGARTNDNIE